MNTFGTSQSRRLYMDQARTESHLFPVTTQDSERTLNGMICDRPALGEEVHATRAHARHWRVLQQALQTHDASPNEGP